MKKVTLKTVVFEEKLPGIVKEMYKFSSQKGMSFKMADVVAFIKKYKDAIAEKLNYIRDFSFQDITLYKVPKVMWYEEVEKLCDIMENAQKFLDNVHNKFCELQRKELAV